MVIAELAERLWALADDGGGRLEKLSELVAVGQQVNRLIAVESARFDATGAFTARSYRSPAAFLSTESRLGQGSARRFVACGRILGEFELLAAAVGAGEITFDHVAVFARLLPVSASDHRRACLVRDEAELVAAAKIDTASEFSRRCVGWRYTVDPDDDLTEELGRETHGMTVTGLDGVSAELRLRGTPGEIEQIRSAINHSAERAWRAQRDATTPNEEEGEAHTDPVAEPASHEPARTGVPVAEAMSEQPAEEQEPAAEPASHEPADAVKPVAEPACQEPAGAGVGDPVAQDCMGEGSDLVQAGRQPLRGRLQLQAVLELVARPVGAAHPVAPLVTVVIDWSTFQLEAERFALGTAKPVDVFAPGYRCETIDGHGIPPAEAFLMALQGEVQRCVIGAPSRKVDLGRSQRLFNAAGRHAVRVRDRTCVHPHCDLPAVWADIDHIAEWQHLGVTDTANAQALCRFHHVRKHDQTVPA